jgi:hypothetical protein
MSESQNLRARVELQRALELTGDGEPAAGAGSAKRVTL